MYQVRFRSNQFQTCVVKKWRELRFIRIVPHDFRDLFIRGQPVCILPAGRSGHADTLHGRIGRIRRNLQNGAEHWMILPAVIPAAPR